MKIYDSLSRKEKKLTSIVKNHIGIYTCGVTVYDNCHIGHSRSMIFMDLFTRYFRSLGYVVNYVRNITDIDDKIIARSFREKKQYKEVVKEFTSSMRKHERLLEIFPPDYEPAVSNYLQEIILLTKNILQKGLGYVNRLNGIYFDVGKFSKYGELSRNTVHLHNSRSARSAKDKSSVQDFALWKKTKTGEPSWFSPWGLGRPGWHIECSAMSMSILGDSFDIHAGGMDLKFPHHENEITQSESVSKKTFARLWMHIGLLRVFGEKMSKSLNNHLSIESVADNYNSEEIRFFMLSSSYRSPINYSHENLLEARSSLGRLYNSLKDLHYTKKFAGEKYVVKFLYAIDNDFNTPLALSILFDIARTIQQLKDLGAIEEAASYGRTLRKLGSFFGILHKNTEKHPAQSDFMQEVPEKVKNLLKEREQARNRKDWIKADIIRQEIKSIGFSINDRSDGTVSVAVLQNS